MAQALLWPLLDEGVVAATDVLAVVGHAASVQRLQAACPAGLTLLAATDPAASAVWGSAIQLLAIKPQQLDTVAATVPAGPTVPPGPTVPAVAPEAPPLLISVLAGVSLERLQKAFPGRRCVRAVPNTPCLVRAGLTGLAWGQGVTAADRERVKAFFSPVSEVLELSEDRLDAFLALTSSGPAYVALVAEAMADGAVAAGLPRDLSHHLAHRTLAGTAALLQEHELHPGQLKDMVASPGGTTMAALRRLEQAGVRSALIEAVVAAAEHGRLLR